MDEMQNKDIERLLSKESGAKKYMLISFMFGVFFLATLKDLISAGFDSAMVIIRLALMLGFALLAAYFYLQSDKVFEDGERDRLDDYRGALEENQEEERQSLTDKYFTKADLKLFKKTLYALLGILFVVFILLALLSSGNEVTEEDADSTTSTTTTTTSTTATE